MFRNEYIDEINRTVKYLRDREEALQYVQHEIERWQATLVEVNNTIRTSGTQESNLDEKKKLASEILIEEGSRAITGTQYDNPLYRNDFIIALGKPEVISIKIGSAKRISVNINLNLVAGDIHDYANAIQKTRKELKVGSEKPTPASHKMQADMWREKYYGPAELGTEIPQPKHQNRLTPVLKKKKKDRVYNIEQYIQKYNTTIRMRKSFFVGLAPFWQIINDGTASDGVQKVFKEKEGSFPEIVGKDFVNKARMRIENLFNLDPGSISASLSELEKEQAKIVGTLDHLDELQRRLSRLPEDINDRPNPELVRSLIERQLGDRYKYADEEKINRLVEQILAGTAGRSRVGQRGQYVRVRVEEIYQQLKNR